MLLLSTLQQFDIEPADFLIVLATVGLALFFILAALCAPLVGLATEGAYVAKGKAFYDKCALQITQAAFGVGMFIFLILAGGAAFLVVQFQPEAPELPELIAFLGPMIFFVPPLIGLVLLMFYLATWSLLKKHRVLHMFLGLLSVLVMTAVFFFGMLFLTNIQAPRLAYFLINAPLPVLRILLADFISTPTLPLIFGCLFCTGIAAASGLAQLWLIMRRFKADYGRDYYAFAMRYCARAALLFTLAGTITGAATYYVLRRSTPPELSQPQDIGIMLIAVGLPLSCCLLWLAIVKSETPLRHKPGAFFACVFLIIALCAQILMLVNTFPMA